MQVQAAQFGQPLNHTSWILRVGIQSRPHRRTANPKATQPFSCLPDSFCIVRYCLRVTAELLSQPQRYGILQVRSTGFNDPVKFDCFVLKGSSQFLDRRKQLIQPPQRSQADGSRDGVVGRLGHVNVVIWINPVLPQLSTQELGGAIGDHLVCIHVVTGSRPGLEGVNHELVVQFSIDHFLGCLGDGIRPLYIQQSQFAVDFGCRSLDKRHRPDERPPGFQPRDREVIHRTLCLPSVQGCSRNLHFAERIAFDTV